METDWGVSVSRCFFFTIGRDVVVDQIGSHGKIQKKIAAVENPKPTHHGDVEQTNVHLATWTERGRSRPPPSTHGTTNGTTHCTCCFLLFLLFLLFRYCCFLFGERGSLGGSTAMVRESLGAKGKKDTQACFTRIHTGWTTVPPSTNTLD